MKFRLSTISIFMLTVLLTSLLGGCTPPATDKAIETSALKWQDKTRRGVYIVSVEPREGRIPIGEFHEWVIDVSDINHQPVTAARIRMTGGMPTHGHGLPTQPQVTEHLGEGRYRIEGVRFSMAGPWVLEFRLDSSIGPDQIQFNVELSF